MRTCGIAVFAFLLVSETNAWSQVFDSSSLTCLQRLSSLVQSGSRIQLLLQDSSQVRGHFSSFDTSTQAITIRVRVKDTTVPPNAPERLFSGLTSELTVPFSNITEICYSKDSRAYKSVAICLAIASGAALGAVLAPSDEGRSFFWEAPKTRGTGWKYGLIGGAVGFGVGVALSSAINPTESIRCP